MEERRKKKLSEITVTNFSTIRAEGQLELVCQPGSARMCTEGSITELQLQIGHTTLLDARPNCTQMSSTAAAATILILKTITKVKVSNEYSFEKLNIFMSVIHNKTPRRCDVSEV